MEAAWLASRLEEGRSIESIAREAGRSASTVAYWVNKHGLASKHARKHAARGGIARAELEALVQAGLSIRQIAAEVDLSPSAVRHWLAKYGLRTQPARYVRGPDKPDVVVRECGRHGWTTFVRGGTDGYLRCG
ncbi:MAG TPA: helix-turn-helix domain-containing protein, partial [Solirubrobacteraceae bacterium]|nr:helix-turn-helix domain-containing protein [Solirubrobacteraceae bacterium]